MLSENAFKEMQTLANRWSNFRFSSGIQVYFWMQRTYSKYMPIGDNHFDAKTTQSGNADDRYGFTCSNTATAPPSSQRAKLSRPLLRTLRAETESALASDGVRAGSST